MVSYSTLGEPPRFTEVLKIKGNGIGKTFWKTFETNIEHGIRKGADKYTSKFCLMLIVVI